MATHQSQIEHLLELHQDALREGRVTELQSVANEILALVVEDLEEGPEPDAELVLCAVARECEERGDWEGAEAAYRERLSLEVDGGFGEYRAHCDLVALLELIGREAEAFEHVRLATATARQSDSQMTLFMALQQETPYWIERGELEQAGTRIAEMLGLLEEDKTHDHLRASAIVLRARLALERGDLTAAEADLNHAKMLLAPLLEWDEAAGIHSTMTRWWATKARLEAARSDLNAAKEAWNEAVAAARHVDALEHVASVYTRATLARMLEQAANALAACGCTSESHAASSEAERIWRDLKLPTWT